MHPSSRCPHCRGELEALKELEPSPEEARLIVESLEAVKSVLEPLLVEFGAEARPAGSWAKGTWVRGGRDVDLFIVIPRSACGLDVARRVAVEAARLLEASGVCDDVKLVKATHWYVKCSRGFIEVEVVPACSIEWGEEPITAMDRSLLHVEYVKRVLGEEGAAEARLLKAFMRGIGVYGAEASVKGFSGYLAELLIAAYKCFRSVLEAAAREWEPPVVVLPPGTTVDHAEALRRRYPDSAMIVPDPVDPWRRNAAAAVHPRRLGEFIVAASDYLSSSCLYSCYSNPPPWSAPRGIWEWLCSRTLLIELEAPGSGKPEEMLVAAALAAAERLAKLIKSRSSGVVVALDYSAWSLGGGRIVVALLLSEPPQPAARRDGPPPWSRPGASRFTGRRLERRGAYWVDWSATLRGLDGEPFDPAREALVRAGEWLRGGASGWRIVRVEVGCPDWAGAGLLVFHSRPRWRSCLQE